MGIVIDMDHGRVFDVVHVLRIDARLLYLAISPFCSLQPFACSALYKHALGLNPDSERIC